MSSGSASSDVTTSDPAQGIPTPASSVDAGDADSTTSESPPVIDVKETDTDLDKDATPKEDGDQSDQTQPEEKKSEASPKDATASESPGDQKDAEALESDLFVDFRHDADPSDLLTAKVGTRLRNRQALSYFAGVEARIKDLEKKLAKLEGQDAIPQKPSEASDKQDDEKSAEDKKWDLSPGWKGLQEFLERPAEPVLPQPIFEVLTVPMGPITGRSGTLIPTSSSHTSTAVDEQKGTTKRDVHRIRINSEYICNVFGNFMDGQEPAAGMTLIRPFKPILAFHDELRDQLSKLEENIDATTSHPPAKEENVESRTTPPTTASSGEDTKKDPEKDPRLERERTVKHLRAFLDFVDEYLREDLASFKRLRTKTPTNEIAKILFSDLWKFFAPGDLVYRPSAQQALRVITVGGGRRILRNRDVESESDRPKEGTMSDFKITCFRLDADGYEVGPVQEEVSIKPFEGLRAVKNLDAYPIQYADMSWPDHEPSESKAESKAPAINTNAIWNQLYERGQKFSQLTNASKVAYKDYEGLSLGVVQEHIDSQVVIDLEKFYLLNPHKRPTLGFQDPNEADFRETSESCQRRCLCSAECFQIMEKNVNLYDDRKVDTILRERAMKEMPDIVKWRSVEDEATLQQSYCHLFPRSIHGFVLKHRDWHPLNIDNISDLKSNKQNFDDLILPPRHKMIVQSLVEMHSLGSKPVEGSANDRPNTTRAREDLVRGKGKGLIILLHGVPGVGKTSTAECVAEYTNRPLYALTCGDVGEDPVTVQKSLQESFSLAHRWGCVMLLDEADVFLAQRNQTDMKRNAVVSVFLRSLEYYSGILFLTTNKVGMFDEAFKSRINISLYYKPLTWDQTIEIWKVNLRRIREVKSTMSFDEESLLKWVKKSWKQMEKDERRPWNGRQIHNAVRTAAALAAFSNANVLTTEHLKAIEKASLQFDKYLEDVHGKDDIGRAEENLERADDKYAGNFFPSRSRTPSTRPRTNQPSSTSKKSKKKSRAVSSSQESDKSESSKSDSDSD